LLELMGEMGTLNVVRTPRRLKRLTKRPSLDPRALLTRTSNESRKLERPGRLPVLMVPRVRREMMIS